MIRRIKQIKWLMTIFLLIILGRLAYIQLYDGPHSGRGLAEKAARRWEMSFVTEEYARGDIVDRNGISLTDSRLASRIVLFPWLLRSADLSGLKASLEINDNIEEKQLQDFWQKVDNVAKAGISAENEPEILFSISDAELLRTVEEARVPGIAVMPVKTRYGSQSVARHFVGYMMQADKLGAAGVEKKFDFWLQGETAEYQMPGIKDVSGNPLPGSIASGPQKIIDKKRCHVITTLEHRLQSFAEKVMDRHLNKGAVVVLDIKSGDVLAMASRPDFDQNRIADYLDKGDALINRAVRAEFYPGSVFKVVTAAAAFESGMVSPRDYYYCSGSYSFDNGIEIGCLKPHGLVNFNSALALSCNGYFVNLVQKTGPELLGSMSRRLGLNCSLNERSNPVMAGNTAIGQQGIKVSPLQMARVYAVIARSGLDIEPRQISLIMDQKGQEIVSYPAKSPVRVLDEAVAEMIKEGLQNAVLNGTAQSGSLEGIATAGKTGTAQANASGRVIAWYCGFIPAEDPEYCIVVMVEENKAGQSRGLQGGQEAAAVFKAIGEYLLK